VDECISSQCRTEPTLSEQMYLITIKTDRCPLIAEAPKEVTKAPDSSRITVIIA